MLAGKRLLKSKIEGLRAHPRKTLGTLLAKLQNAAQSQITDKLVKQCARVPWASHRKRRRIVWGVFYYYAWCWMMLIDSHLCWLMLLGASWCWLMLLDADWCWDKLQPGFLFLKGTSGVSPVICMKEWVKSVHLAQADSSSAALLVC